MVHELKLNIAFCNAVYKGEKPFEIRWNDRAFQKGDRIHFTPVDKHGMPIDHEIIKCVFDITFVLHGWGMKEGFVALGIQRSEDADEDDNC